MNHPRRRWSRSSGRPQKGDQQTYKYMLKWSISSPRLTLRHHAESPESQPYAGGDRADIHPCILSTHSAQTKQPSTSTSTSTSISTRSTTCTIATPIFSSTDQQTSQSESSRTTCPIDSFEHVGLVRSHGGQGEVGTGGWACVGWQHAGVHERARAGAGADDEWRWWCRPTWTGNGRSGPS